MQIYEEFVNNIIDNIKINDLGLNKQNREDVIDEILKFRSGMGKFFNGNKDLIIFLTRYLDKINEQEEYEHTNINSSTNKLTVVKIIGNYTKETISPLYVKTLLFVGSYYYLFEIKDFNIEKEVGLSFNNSLKKYLTRSLEIFISTNNNEIKEELNDPLFLKPQMAKNSAIDLYLKTLLYSKIFDQKIEREGISRENYARILKEIEISSDEKNFLIKMFHLSRILNNKMNNEYKDLNECLLDYLSYKNRDLYEIIDKVEFAYKEYEFQTLNKHLLLDILNQDEYERVLLLRKKEEIIFNILGENKYSIDSIVSIKNITNLDNNKNINENNQNELYEIVINGKCYLQMLMSKYLINVTINTLNIFTELSKVYFLEEYDFEKERKIYTLRVKYDNNNSTITFDELFNNFKDGLVTILEERKDYEKLENSLYIIEWESKCREKMLYSKLANDNNNNSCNNIDNGIITNRKKI